jgi:predicted dinucleotide-binding enzyme
MGGTLGTLFARAGHEVVISYARSREKLDRLARNAQGNARAGTPREAAQGGGCPGGDKPAGKRVAAELIHDVGFEPIDAGPLRMARYTEPMALLIAELAYGGREGLNWPTGSSGSGTGRVTKSGQTLRKNLPLAQLCL